MNSENLKGVHLPNTQPTRKEQPLSKPIWLQVSLDTSSKCVAIIGLSDDRYMVAKRNATLRAAGKPIVVVNLRDQVVTVLSQLKSFFLDQGLSNDEALAGMELINKGIRRIFTPSGPAVAPVQAVPIIVGASNDTLAG